MGWWASSTQALKAHDSCLLLKGCVNTRAPWPSRSRDLSPGHMRDSSLASQDVSPDFGTPGTWRGQLCTRDIRTYPVSRVVSHGPQAALLLKPCGIQAPVSLAFLELQLAEVPQAPGKDSPYRELPHRRWWGRFCPWPHLRVPIPCHPLLLWGIGFSMPLENMKVTHGTEAVHLASLSHVNAHTGPAVRTLSMTPISKSWHPVLGMSRTWMPTPALENPVHVLDSAYFKRKLNQRHNQG